MRRLRALCSYCGRSHCEVMTWLLPAPTRRSKGRRRTEISSIVESKRPTVRQVYLGTHRLVLEVVPDVRYAVDTVDAQIGYGARQFGYDGWGMAALAPYTNWVSLAFLRGAESR